MNKITKIGEGAYATVYLPDNDPETAYKVASKYPPGIVREIIFVSQCCHPNIVYSKGYSIGGNVNFETLGPRSKTSLNIIKMERADLTLLDLIRQPENIKWEILQLLLFDILVGLEYLEQNRIMHLDVKPDNILLYNLDSTPRAVICDFGLSVHQNWKLSPELAGTSWYRAPEIFQEGQITCKADVWAFAMMLIEAVTGVPVMCQCNARSSVGWIRAIRERCLLDGSDQERHQHWCRFLKANWKIDDGQEHITALGKIISRCLDADPHRRWSCKRLLAHEMWGSRFYQARKLEHRSLQRPFLQTLELGFPPRASIIDCLVNTLLTDPLDDHHILATVSLAYDLCIRVREVKQIWLAWLASYCLAFTIYSNVDNFDCLTALVNFARDSKYVTLTHTEGVEMYIELNKIKDQIREFLEQGIVTCWRDSIYTNHIFCRLDQKNSRVDWIEWWKWFKDCTGSNLLSPNELNKYMQVFQDQPLSLASLVN